MKLIILIGQRVRSGTNFVGVTLTQHPQVQMIPSGTSIGELNLFTNDSIKTDVFEIIAKRSFALGIKNSDFPEFIEAYGAAWMELISKKYDLDSSKTLFIKSPYIKNILLWKLAFPHAKIAVLSRDGRDNVISSIKASNDKRNWHRAKHRIKRKINYYSGRFFIKHSEDWAKTARIYAMLISDKSLEKFKYEELINSSEGIKKLLNFYELDSSDENILKCLGAPVIGSSFGIKTSKMTKPNWKPDFDKSNYKFTKKWEKWSWIQRKIFYQIAGNEMTLLGYFNRTSKK